jgi:DNA-binding GntR family transcriptional regulator
MATDSDLSLLAVHVHRQIAGWLVNLAPGDCLPGEIELAARCRVSRTTVRRVLHKMERAGVVCCKDGRRILARKIRTADLPKRSEEPVSRDRQVVRYVLDQIGRGAVKPGDAISEKKIATTLGFSTGTVREGLLLLAPMGLFRKRARRQWEAVAPTAEQWGHIMELRLLVEEHCLKKLLQEKDAEWPRAFIEKHLRLTRQLSKSAKINMSKLRELDMKFHQWLLDSADNPVLSERHRFIYLLIEFQLHSSRFTEERARLGLDQHIAIMNAMLTGDSTAAVLRLRKHLTSALETLKSIAPQSPAIPADQRGL